MARTHVIVNDYSNLGTSDSNVGVFVRFRPLQGCTKEQERSLMASFIHMKEGDNKTIELKDPSPDENKSHYEVKFAFDQIFETDSSQDEIFEIYAKPQILHTLSGYNSCLFAYGQTGSGKTYSMFGEQSEGTVTYNGVIPRTVDFIFEQLRDTPNEVAVGCSFLEIYNERIRDLTRNYVISKENPEQSFKSTSALYEEITMKSKDAMMDRTSEQWAKFQADYEAMNCEILQDQNGRVYVKNLTTLSVTSGAEALDIVEFGMALRATHETKMNATSSRSHTVFSLYIAQTIAGTKDTIFGQLNLVDLAGSERQQSTGSEGSRFREANHINTSLSALGKVIVALDPNSGVMHVPYRESKLTRVLQNSLSRNSYVSVLAHVHPRPQWYEESLSTLEFANRLRKVHNTPHVNHFSSIELATKWTYTPKLFGNVVHEPELIEPKGRLMYSVEPKLYWKLNTYAKFEIYEHLENDLVEVMAFDPDSDVEFNHLYLTKSELFSIYKKEVTIFEKRKLQQQHKRQERQHHQWSSSTKVEHHDDVMELSEEAWLARDSAARDKWIGEFIMHRMNPVAKTETDPPSLSLEPAEHDIRNEDGVLPFVSSCPEGARGITRSTPPGSDRQKAIDDKINEQEKEHGKVENAISKAGNYQETIEQALLDMHRLDSPARKEEEFEHGHGVTHLAPLKANGSGEEGHGSPQKHSSPDHHPHSSRHLFKHPSMPRDEAESNSDSSPTRQHHQMKNSQSAQVLTSSSSEPAETEHLPSVIPQRHNIAYPDVVHGPYDQSGQHKHHRPPPSVSSSSHFQSATDSASLPPVPPSPARPSDTHSEEHLPSVAHSIQHSHPQHMLGGQHSFTTDDVQALSNTARSETSEFASVSDRSGVPDEGEDRHHHHHKKHHHHHHHKKHHHHSKESPEAASVETGDT